jgi:hypothetical protein
VLGGLFCLGWFCLVLAAGRLIHAASGMVRKAPWVRSVAPSGAGASPHRHSIDRVCRKHRTSYENVADQGVTARRGVRKPGPEMIPAHVRHAAHVSRLRSRHEAREQKRNKPWPTGPH